MRQAEILDSSPLRLGVYRVTTLEKLSSEWQPDIAFAVLVQSSEDRDAVERLRFAGMPDIAWVQSREINEADVIVRRSPSRQVAVLYRESDTHHALFMTNRCNSLCLMCSQPPTRQDDSWLVLEAMGVLRHIRVSPNVIGLTGGEPLILRGALRTFLDDVANRHPSTRVELLTNGRMLSEPDLAILLLAGLKTPTRWLVPLYGHADFIHDFIVQTRGAFEETIEGLLALQNHSQPIQLRIVLIEPVLKILPELCAFIGRNLPFVSEVALMGCEPTGFALANRELCEVDLGEWAVTLLESTRVLRRHGVPFVLMNTPLCAVPQPLWPQAAQSISDWKNVYAAECGSCSERYRCSGLFRSHSTGWRPIKLQPLMEAA